MMNKESIILNFEQLNAHKKVIFKYIGKTLIFFIIALLCTSISTVDEMGVRHYQFIFQYGGITVVRFLLSMLLSVILCYIASGTRTVFSQETLWFLSFTPALCVVFFAFPIVTTWDTALYHVLVKILEGELSWSSWDAVRGIGFPIVLTLFRKIFGLGRIGMLTGMFFCYQLFLIYAIKLFCEVGLNITTHPKFYKIFGFLVCFNPLLLGGFHALLCEFVGALIAMMSIYYAYRWSKTPITTWQSQIGYVVYFLIMSIFSYHLKQTYIAAVIFPVIAAAIIALLRFPSKVQWIYRVGTIVLCAAGVLISIKIWYSFLNFQEVDPERLVTTGSIAQGISRNLVQYEPIEQLNKQMNMEWKSDAYLSEEEKESIDTISQELLERNDKLYNIVDWEGNIIDHAVFLQKDRQASTQEEISFLWKELRTHPRAVVSSWIKNYLGLSDILKVEASPNNVSIHIPTSQVEFGTGNENNAIFYRGYFAREIGENVIWIDPLYEEYRNIDLEQIMYNYFNPFVTSYTATMLNQMFISLFVASSYQILVITLPLLFIGSFAILLIEKRKKREAFPAAEIIFTMSAYGFLQTVIHAIIMMAIDRYVFASYAVAIVVCLSAVALVLKSIGERKYIW